MSGARQRDGIGVERHRMFSTREGQNPSSSPHGLPKRVQRVVKRRILRLQPRKGKKQVGNRERGCRSAGSGWQKSVGRIAVLMRNRECLAQGRSVSR